MVTVNNRLGLPQAIVINGVDAGGAMTATINAGYDNIMRSAPDGLQVPIKDKEAQFVRGTIVSQDWLHAIELLTNEVGSYVFYERRSGVAALAGYVTHTLTAPVIHRFTINMTKGGYATVSFDFECRAADTTATIADMWASADAEAAPAAYISAARGGFRIKTCTHGAVETEITVYHLMGLTFSITMPLVKACNDADVAYTCVDARVDGMVCDGSISFQDGAITTSLLKAQELLLAAKADLVLVVTQSQGGADKTITIANADFNSIASSSDAGAPFTGYTASFDVANDADTPLTLEVAPKIIAIA